MQIERDDGFWYSAEYSTFSISDEVGKYRLTVAGYSGDAGDSFNDVVDNRISNDMMFSTPDVDNDESFGGHCAAGGGGRGWWDRRCSASCLNRVTEGGWRLGDDDHNDVLTSRMLVKGN